MAMEDPLRGVVGVGLGQAVGVLFGGDFGPMVEIKGRFFRNSWRNIDFLI